MKTNGMLKQPFFITDKKVQVHQDRYNQHMQPINVKPSRAMEKDSPPDDKERDLLRSKIGQILWMARQDRPDGMFNASSLASTIKTATVQTLHEANFIV